VPPFLGGGDGALGEFSEERELPFAPGHVFSVVAAVEHYELFVPWCVSSVVTRRHARGLDADLVVGFRGLSARYTSAVTLDEGARRVRAVASGTPLFETLENEWLLAPAGSPSGESTRLRFGVKWRFRSALLGAASVAFRDEVARRMVSAFEERCHATAPAWRAKLAAADAEMRRLAAATARAAPENDTSAAALSTMERAPRFPPPLPLGPGVWL
jgi:coenzyme Q-binding protein COQ10